jgi:hypothetical protein
MKYDDASWHSGGEFPAELPAEAGATHIGMFVAWALLAGLAGELVTDDLPEAVAPLKARSVTPGALVLSAFDGKFTDEELNPEGNSFAEFYYDSDAAQYLDDYADALSAGTPDGPHGLYYIADTWANFDRLKPVLDRRFAEWRHPRL